ncbi:MAG: histidine acid phosphatase [Bacteroidaceae bacterium]|nr:histidine acid phosphatase [Bacteroidaceae bacterium]
MRNVFLTLLLLLVASLVSAQTAREEIYADLHRSASNYLAYPAPENVTYTPAPRGYKPFYISHYARHGSRWLIGRDEYPAPVRRLRRAQKAGVLTADGERALAVLDSVERMSHGRLGELTPLGHRQHKGIAERMYRNFPEVFSGNVLIDARSTVVIRCILSMQAECLALQALNPKLRFRNDASHHDMYYMNYEQDEALASFRKAPEARQTRDDFWNSTVDSRRFVRQLISDEQYIRDSVNSDALMNSIFNVCSNMQSLDTSLDLYWLFTPEECYALWRNSNLSWYINYGPSPLTKGKMPYYEANLLRNIIETADTCVTLEHPGATLRFGHEVVVYPLAALLELGDCGKVYNNPATLEDHIRNYKIFPMASNVQLIFFRKKGSDDILVKAMLNEHEMTLPVRSDVAPYYHWSDLRAYYLQKLAAFKIDD